MKKKSTTLSKLEKSRYSILTNDMEHCIACRNNAEDINEVFLGRNRVNSMKYGLCIPMCRKCHEKYHIDRHMQLYYMKIGYNCFIQLYSIKEFKDKFKYIKGLDIF